jgi:hypothetical protein
MIIRLAQNCLNMLWYGAVVFVLAIGWMVREQRYLVAESGIGYWLGIIGGLLMVMLLIYPLRKRKPQWRYIGSVKFWFRFHMVMGIGAPVLIIYHSGYQLGSLNGRVAFFSMIIVALSGLVGRYFYRRVHHGLHGEKIRFEELYKTDDDWLEKLPKPNASIADLAARLRAIEVKITNTHIGVDHSCWYYFSLSGQLKRLQKRVSKQISTSSIRQLMLARIKSLRSICRLEINETMFSYWHILHFPLFLMLIVSALIHVFVVHFY